MVSPVKIWRHQKRTEELIGKTGRTAGFTLIRVAPKEYKQQAPYPSVVVEMNSGQKVVGQLVDWQKKHLRIGQKVKAVYRKIRESDSEGIIPYGIKFKPIKENG